MKLNKKYLIRNIHKRFCLFQKMKVPELIAAGQRLLGSNPLVATPLALLLFFWTLPLKVCNIDVLKLYEFEELKITRTTDKK